MERLSRTPARLLVFGVVAAALIALHWTYLPLPYFWDELGQFVPAALDILNTNAWVPHSTVPNVHPPLVMAYLAGVWRLFGYSVVATRVAMLLVAAAGVYATWLLGTRLCRGLPGAPALVAAGLLTLTPLFYTQSMMAQLDMPAMTLTVAALLLFLDRRYFWCAVVSTALVLAKETGIVAPALFCAWLVVRDRNWKQAAWFVLPAMALAAWLFVLWRSTGYLLGDPGFAHYNVAYQLNPIRLSATILRRLYYLFFADLRWIGTVVILLALRTTRLFSRWEWFVAALYGVGHTLLVSAFGGAALERYLLPVFPLLYVAMGSAWAAVAPRWRYGTQAALVAGLVAGLFWNPPFPFPLENNLAMVDFVELQKEAAAYLDQHAPRAIVASAWPYTGALRSPALGFTRHPYRVVETSDFHVSKVVQACTAARPDVLVVYARTWEPHWGALSNELIEQFLRKYYDYEPQITQQEVQSRLGFRLVSTREQRGQWIQVYAR